MYLAKMGHNMGVVTFARKLLTTGDLDPLYIALWEARLERSELCKWLVCYWCYYHAGLSCWAVSQRDFFGTLLKIAEGETNYPRGTERRHFRKNLAISSVNNLKDKFSSAEDMVDWLLDAGPSASNIMKRVKTLRGFGEWICWKIPDMLERLDLGMVEFVEQDLEHMFKTSKEGAKTLCNVYDLNATNNLQEAHHFLIRRLGKRLAPPRYERVINVQETETILCKWKSHLGGHYPVGKDTIEIEAGLLDYNRKLCARKLLRGLQRGLTTGTKREK